MFRRDIVRVIVALFVWHLLPEPVKARKADVVLYGEALCPYTVGAINDVIGPLFDGGLSDSFHFRYVAWGNARNTTNVPFTLHGGFPLVQGGVVCQHGPSECNLNRVMGCGWELGRKRKGAGVAFVRCLSEQGVEGMEGAVAPCAEHAGLRPSDIDTCMAGPQGEELERAAAEETSQLHPPHTYVPWVTVNGVALGEDLGNLRKYICVGIKPKKRPAECSAPPDSPAATSTSTLSGGVQLAVHGDGRLGVGGEGVEEGKDVLREVE